MTSAPFAAATFAAGSAVPPNPGADVNPPGALAAGFTTAIDDLAHAIRTTTADVHTPLRIATPTSDTGRWVRAALTHKLGIVAGIDFVAWRPHRDSTDPWSEAALRWRLLALGTQDRDWSWRHPALRWSGNGAVPAALLTHAGRLAQSIVQLLDHVPDRVTAWAAGEPHDLPALHAWQAEVVGGLADDDPDSVALLDHRDVATTPIWVVATDAMPAGLRSFWQSQPHATIVDVAPTGGTEPAPAPANTTLHRCAGLRGQAAAVRDVLLPMLAAGEVEPHDILITAADPTAAVQAFDDVATDVRVTDGTAEGVTSLPVAARGALYDADLRGGLSATLQLLATEITVATLRDWLEHPRVADRFNLDVRDRDAVMQALARAGAVRGLGADDHTAPPVHEDADDPTAANSIRAAVTRLHLAQVLPDDDIWEGYAGVQAGADDRRILTAATAILEALLQVVHLRELVAPPAAWRDAVARVADYTLSASGGLDDLRRMTAALDRALTLPDGLSTAVELDLAGVTRLIASPRAGGWYEPGFSAGGIPITDFASAAHLEAAVVVVMHCDEHRLPAAGADPHDLVRRGVVAAPPRAARDDRRVADDALRDLLGRSATVMATSDTLDPQTRALAATPVAIRNHVTEDAVEHGAVYPAQTDYLQGSATGVALDEFERLSTPLQSNWRLDDNRASAELDTPTPITLHDLTRALRSPSLPWLRRHGLRPLPDHADVITTRPHRVSSRAQPQLLSDVLHHGADLDQTVQLMQAQGGLAVGPLGEAETKRLHAMAKQLAEDFALDGINPAPVRATLERGRLHFDDTLYVDVDKRVVMYATPTKKGMHRVAEAWPRLPLAAAALSGDDDRAWHMIVAMREDNDGNAGMYLLRMAPADADRHLAHLEAFYNHAESHALALDTGPAVHAVLSGIRAARDKDTIFVDRRIGRVFGIDVSTDTLLDNGMLGQAHTWFGPLVESIVTDAEGPLENAAARAALQSAVANGGGGGADA